jgi:hypothetical protein
VLNTQREGEREHEFEECKKIHKSADILYTKMYRV